MTRKERKELENEVRRMYFALKNQDYFASDYCKAEDVITEVIEKVGSPLLEKLLELRRLIRSMNNHACDAFSDLMDDDVARAFIKAGQDSPEKRRLCFAQRQMERLGE